MTTIDNGDQSKKFFSIIESSVDGILLLDSIRDDHNKIIDFKISHCNKVGCQLARFPNDALGKTLLQVLPHLAGGDQYDLHRQVVETGISQEFETTFVNDKGDEYGWFMVSLQKIDDGVLSRFIDITDKFYYKQKIENQAELLNSILDASQHSIVAFKAVKNSDDAIVDFTFLNVNNQFLKLIGRERDAIIGSSYLKYLEESGEEGMFALKKQVVITGQPHQGEVLFSGKGKDAWLNVSITRLGTDGVVQTIVNVTESRNDKDRLNKIINTSGAGIITLKPIRNEQKEIVDFTFCTMNKAFENFLGMDTTPFANQPVSSVFSYYLGTSLFLEFAATYSSGEPKTFEFFLEGGYNAHLNVRCDKMGHELLVTFVDQTEIKQLQENLQQSIIDLKRSNESLEDFTSAASHDLKEPIRKINILLSHLRSKHGATLENDPFNTLVKLETASKRMILLIDDLLEYSHLSHEVLDWEEVELDELLSGILEDLDMLIEEKKAIINAGELPVVYGHRRQLQQLFQNLIQNSLKYSKENIPPVIDISAQSVQGLPADASLSTDRVGSWYHQITIADNGIGFNNDETEKIFNLFERLHGNHHSKGSGVGLAIAKKVVENHKGQIVAKGELDKGATFIINFPNP